MNYYTKLRLIAIPAYSRSVQMKIIIIQFTGYLNLVVLLNSTLVKHMMMTFIVTNRGVVIETVMKKNLIVIMRFFYCRVWPGLL